MTILFTAPLSIFNVGLSNAGRRSKFFSEKAATLRRSALRGARRAASRVVQRNCHTLRKTSLRRSFGGEPAHMEPQICCRGSTSTLKNGPNPGHSPSFPSCECGDHNTLSNSWIISRRGGDTARIHRDAVSRTPQLLVPKTYFWI
jgi:hypothetical protein